MFSAAALVVGSALAPLCACLCEAAVTAGEADGHAHHESDAPTEPGASHTDEDAGCGRLTATLPNSTMVEAPYFHVGPQPMIATRRGEKLWEFAAIRSGSGAALHEDRGPPIPLPLFAILRP